MFKTFTVTLSPHLRAQTVIDSSGAHLRDRSDRVRGKHRPGTSGKARTRTGKGGGEKPALAQTNASSARRDEDMRDIKEQLSSLMQLVPVITEIKAAYDHYNDMERDDLDRHLSEAELSLSETGESTDAAQDIPDTVGYFNTLTGTCAPQETTVNQELASGVEKVLTDGMSKGTLSALLDPYHAPANCSLLSVLQCNPEIFKNTSQSAKARDSALQNIQKALIKGLTAILLAFDDLSAILQPAQSGAMKQIADVVALLAHSSHALDLFRRHAFKGELKEEYSSLCGGAHPVVGALFGPNVQDRVKELNDTLRMARSTQRFHPYSYNRGTRRFPCFRPAPAVAEKGRGLQQGPAAYTNISPSSRCLGPAEKADTQTQTIGLDQVPKTNSYSGGKLKNFSKEWGKYTSDPFLLSCIEGCRLNFDTVPIQSKVPRPLKLKREQIAARDKMINEFESDKVITKCKREEGDYINNVFFLKGKKRFL